MNQNPWRWLVRGQMPPWMTGFDRNWQPGETYGANPSAEDRAWNAANPYGYGLTDNPSPWGYNRDAYNAEYPNGPPNGYYNPSTGFYDSPTEQPFQMSGLSGPEMIGTGGGGESYASPGSDADPQSEGQQVQYDPVVLQALVDFFSQDMHYAP